MRGCNFAKHRAAFLQNAATLCPAGIFTGSILRHGGVYLPGPGGDAAGDVPDVVVAQVAQGGDGAGAAAAEIAMNKHLHIARDFSSAGCDLTG